MPNTREEWLPIEDFPSYQVSSLGRIRRRSGRIKSTYTSDGRYRRVELYRDGVPYWRTVHVIVARAFLGKRPQGMTVRFKNGNATDCELQNLSYGTANYDPYLIPKKYGRPK